jgi:hypothetical protein
MASFSIPAVVALAGTAVSAGGAAYESHEQGVATQAADTQKARVEQLDESQKQINMRQNMLKALASQNAGTLGAVGTGVGTGFGANAMRQITQSQNDLMVSQANSSAQVSLLDSAGSEALAAGNIGGVSDLLGGAVSIAKSWPQSPPTPPSS